MGVATIYRRESDITNQYKFSSADQYDHSKIGVAFENTFTLTYSVGLRPCVQSKTTNANLSACHGKTPTVRNNANKSAKESAGTTRHNFLALPTGLPEELAQDRT